MSSNVLSAVGPRSLPAETLSRSSLADPHYADEFTLVTPVASAGTAEDWARAMFGDEPSATERMIWAGFLNIRLISGKSADTVAGWQIADRCDDWIRLEARSWFMTWNLIVSVGPDTVSLATLSRHDRHPFGVIWTLLSRVHRRLVPGLLRGAAGKMQMSAP